VHADWWSGAGTGRSFRGGGAGNAQTGSEGFGARPIDVLWFGLSKTVATPEQGVRLTWGAGQFYGVLGPARLLAMLLQYAAKADSSKKRRQAAELGEASRGCFASALFLHDASRKLKKKIGNAVKLLSVPKWTGLRRWF